MYSHEKKEIHSGCVYVVFEKLISKIECYLNKKSCSYSHHNSSTIHNRIMQRIVELTLISFVVLYKSEVVEHNTHFFYNEKKIALSNLKINAKTGNVKISLSLLIRSCAEFSYEWIGIFVAILKSFYNTNSINSLQVTLLFGLGNDMIEHNGNDKRFVKYCRNGPILPLNKANCLYVQNNISLNGSDKYIQYSNKPINRLISNSGLVFNESLTLLSLHLLTPFKFITSIFRFPLIIILGRDIALISVMNYLDKKKLIQDIVITNSNFFRQPLWMRTSTKRNFRVHEIHYSQNTIPFVYKCDDLVTNYPALKYVTVDEHWVWTTDYKLYIQKLGHTGPIHVVGSIMFYLPVKLSYPNTENIVISVFDITPVQPHIEDKIGLINNYYSTVNMIQFINDIVHTCNELEHKLNKKITIQLKHKREFMKSHDSSYIEFCKNLESQNEIEILNFNVDIYQFVSNCNAVISVPYTSAAYIACEMNVPSIYYDSTAQLIPKYESKKGLKMVSNRSLLGDVLYNAVA